MPLPPIYIEISSFVSVTTTTKTTNATELHWLDVPQRVVYIVWYGIVQFNVPLDTL